jgi:hypothetical protein
VACVSIQSACFGLQTESRGRPETGTPRAAYCGPIDHSYRWLLFPVVAVLITVALSRLLARVPRGRSLAVSAVCLLAIANYLVVASLGYFSAV